jgi:hypothetical protein
MNKQPSYIALRSSLRTGPRRGLQNLLIRLYDLFDGEVRNEY